MVKCSGKDTPAPATINSTGSDACRDGPIFTVLLQFAFKASHHDVGQRFYVQAAIEGLVAVERPLLGKLVARVPAAANREIAATALALRDAGLDFGIDFFELRIVAEAL